MLKKYILFVSLFISTITIAQTISTVTQESFTDALALDSQGNLYCSDWSGNTVYKYSTSGVVTTFKDGFWNPNGIGINASDEIYICDHTRNRIYKYDTDGNQIVAYLGLFTTPAGIKNIPNTTDMLVVEYGNSFTATGTNSKIKKLEADGTVTTLHTGLPLNGPAGIAFINDIPYIANFNDRKIFKFENGTLTEIAQLPSEGPANRNFLGFMSAIDNQLIATHIGGHKVYKIDPISGVASVYAGSSIGNTDGDISTATLDSPNGIIGDEANDKIYISQGSLNTSNRNLRIISGAVLSAGTINLEEVEITAFPNPNKDSLNIKLSGFETSQIELSVFDALGKEVFKQKFENIGESFEEKIQTSGWGKGIYFLKIKSGKKVLTKKIVIE
jgi:hypothetical protein